MPMVDALKAYKVKLDVRRPEQIDWLLAPLFGLKLSAQKRDIVFLLQKKADTAPVMANRMLSRWKDFFNFCVQQGWLEHNPLEGVERRFVGGREVSRTRNLSWDEIHTLLTAPPIPNPWPLWFILLTGLRPSEALWVLKNRKTEDIPTKTTPHTLPRSRLIQWFLMQDYVVPSSDLTTSNALRRAGATYTPHDLRRTFVSRLSDLGVMPHVVEKLVNHKMQGVMAVYNHAEYWPDRVAAQRKWDRQLLAIRRKKAPE